jgi:uncharacterized protein (TIGR02172 family)
MSSSTAKIELGPFLAKGFTSELYALGSDRVVKLYQPWMRREKLEWEFAATKALHDMGLPVPNAFERVEIDGRLGLVLEYVDGISMLRHSMRRPWRLIAIAREFAELHAQLHSHRAPNVLPSQQTQIEDWIARGTDLSVTDRAAAEEALRKISPGDAVCHGDFHPENILMTAKGPVIIDWSTGTRGNPIGDVARTVSLFRQAEVPEEWSLYTKAMVAFGRRFLLQFYLRRYFELRPGSPADLEVWEPIQKAAVSAWRARMEHTR